MAKAQSSAEIQSSSRPPSGASSEAPPSISDAASIPAKRSGKSRSATVRKPSGSAGTIPLPDKPAAQQHTNQSLGSTNTPPQEGTNTTVQAAAPAARTSQRIPQERASLPSGTASIKKIYKKAHKELDRMVDGTADGVSSSAESDVMVSQADPSSPLGLTAQLEQDLETSDSIPPDTDLSGVPYGPAKK